VIKRTKFKAALQNRGFFYVTSLLHSTLISLRCHGDCLRLINNMGPFLNKAVAKPLPLYELQNIPIIFRLYY
jgi:hypothetical protein